jgi:hypothetical protein
MTERDNLAVQEWPLPTGKPGREVWYGFVTDGDRPLALWYRYTVLSTVDGHQEGRCWVGVTDGGGDLTTFGTVAVPVDSVLVEHAPFALVLGESCDLSDRRVRAEVETPEGTVRWDLTHEPDPLTFTPLRSRVVTGLAGRLLGTGNHWSVNQSVPVSGTLEVGDERVEFADAPGHQGHTVGSETPDRWRWVHCNGFDDPDLTIEALDLGGRVSICLRTGDERHLLNRLVHVVGPWANETVAAGPGTWTFTGCGDGAELRCRVDADEDHYQRVAYLCPDGSKRYNAHCSLSQVELSFRTEHSDGWSDWRTAESDTGRAEWVDTDPPVDGEYGPVWVD